MGQKPAGLAGEPDYVPAATPGGMHTHKVLPGEMSIGEAVGRGGQWTEPEVQARRAGAKEMLRAPANYDPRDVNLPVDKPKAAAAPKRTAAPRAANKPKSMAGRR
jgi:hypothetical protein